MFRRALSTAVTTLRGGALSFASPLPRAVAPLAQCLLRGAAPRASALSAPVRAHSRKATATGFKIKGSIKKRFRLRGGGAIVRLRSGKRHLNIHKSRRHVHRLGACFRLARAWGARYMRALIIAAPTPLLSLHLLPLAAPTPVFVR